MDTMTTKPAGCADAARYAAHERFLSPTGQLRPTGGVRLRAFGTLPTISPPGPQLSR